MKTDKYNFRDLKEANLFPTEMTLLQWPLNEQLHFQVSENDKLPVQLCYQCASTLIAWHDMVLGCLEADQKLKALLPHDEEQTADVSL